MLSTLYPSSFRKGLARSHDPHQANQTLLCSGILSSPMTENNWELTPLKNFFLIEVQLIYNVVLVSGIQQSDSVIHLYSLIYVCVCVHAKSLQSCPTLWNSMACSPPGSSFHRILQARIVEWVAMPSSKGTPQPRDQTLGQSCIGRRVLYH